MSSSATRARDGARARIASAAPTESAAAAHTAGCTPLPQSRVATRNHRIDTERSAAPATAGMRGVRRVSSKPTYAASSTSASSLPVPRRSFPTSSRSSSTSIKRGRAASASTTNRSAPPGRRLGTGIAVATTSRSAASPLESHRDGANGPSGVRKSACPRVRPRCRPRQGARSGRSSAPGDSPSLRT